MHPEEIRSIVGSTPHTPPDRGQVLYEFIKQHRLARCLELGFAHGVGTVWLAGAVRALGGGKVIAVDNQSALKRTPSARELVQRAGLEELVELHFDSLSYTWHLQRHLASYMQQPFDFVFIDGAHTWDTDGFAFFLVEKLLRPGGWIVFDDLNWTYAGSPSLRETELVRSMTDEYKNTPQVRMVWESLVLQHPQFGNFIEDEFWGWSQKVLSPGDTRQLEIRTVSRSLPERIMRKLRGVAARRSSWNRQSRLSHRAKV